MLDDLEFERQIGEMEDRQLMEFIARQAFASTKRFANHDIRIRRLENQRGPGARMIAAVGAAVGGAIAGLVYGLIAVIKGQS